MGGGGILRVRLRRVAVRKVLLSFKFCNVFVNAKLSLLETTFMNKEENMAKVMPICLIRHQDDICGCKIKLRAS